MVAFQLPSLETMVAFQFLDRGILKQTNNHHQHFQSLKDGCLPQHLKNKQIIVSITISRYRKSASLPVLDDLDVDLCGETEI